MPELKLNLTTTDAYTDSVPVGVATTLAASLSVRSSFTWSTAVATLQWTVDEDESVWVDYPAAQFGLSSGTQGRPRLSVAGVRAIRWRCSTAEAANDPEATVDYLLT